MTMSAAGDLYLADHSLPIVYALKSGAERLVPVFASKGLIALRGIAVNDSGELIFVADHELGIVRVDLASGQVSMLVRPETLNMGGITGLEYVDGDLLVIQSGISPQRIMRLVLDNSATRVNDIAPVVVAPEGIDRPNYGTIVDDKLYFLARVQSTEDEKSQRPLRIAVTGVEGLQNIVPPDMQRYLEQQAQQRMQPPTPLRPVSAEPENDKND
jgi:hypothetical protein